MSVLLLVWVFRGSGCLGFGSGCCRGPFYWFVGCIGPLYWSGCCRGPLYWSVSCIGPLYWSACYRGPFVRVGRGPTPDVQTLMRVWRADTDHPVNVVGFSTADGHTGTWRLYENVGECNEGGGVGGAGHDGVRRGGARRGGA